MRKRFWSSLLSVSSFSFPKRCNHNFWAFYYSFTVASSVPEAFLGEEKNKPGIYTLLLNQLLPLLPSQTTPLERRGSRAPKCHRGPRTANRTRWRVAGPSWGAAAAPRLPPSWATGLRSAGPGWGVVKPRPRAPLMGKAGRRDRLPSSRELRQSRLAQRLALWAAVFSLCFFSGRAAAAPWSDNGFDEAAFGTDLLRLQPRSAPAAVEVQGIQARLGAAPLAPLPELPGPSNHHPALQRRRGRC